MFDRRLQAVLASPLHASADVMANRGIRANQVTVVGFGFGVMACVALAFGLPLLALGLFALNRTASLMRNAGKQQPPPPNQRPSPIWVG